MSKYIKLEDALKEFNYGTDYPVNTIIDILYGLPTIEASEDCISRAYAIEVLSHVKKDEQWRTECIDNEIRLIKLLPSVLPTTEKSLEVGEWIINEPEESGLGTIYECPYCKYEVECKPTNFCPNCGARMKGAE